MIVETYYDCYEAIIANILDHFHFPVKAYFNQAGLIYHYKKEDHDNPKRMFWISTKSTSYEDTLNEEFGIQLTKLKLTQQLRKDNLLQLLKENSLIFVVDTYYLPYCRSFGNEHYNHFVIVKLIENQIHVMDPFYRFNDFIDSDVLIKSINYVFQQQHNFNYISIERHQNNTFQKTTTDILKINQILMLSTDVYQIPEDHIGYVGIAAIKKIHTLLVNFIDNNDLTRIDFLAESIGDIKNSRRQTADYFDLLNQVTLKNLYFSASQSWQILLNYLIKMILTDKLFDHCKEKISELFEVILANEQAILFNLSH